MFIRHKREKQKQRKGNQRKYSQVTKEDSATMKQELDALLKSKEHSKNKNKNRVTKVKIQQKVWKINSRKSPRNQNEKQNKESFSPYRGES